MNLNHIMVDLETFATGRDLSIVSIGACIFDPKVGRWPKEGDDLPEVDATFHQKIDLTAGPKEHVGQIDPATVEWWLKQSDEARAALIEGERVPLKTALETFSEWLWKAFSPAHLARYDTKVRLWANGPMFDENGLRDAFERCGLEFPIHFKSSRCCRTIFDLAIEAGWNYKAIGKNPLKHDALSDAIWQARGVCEMYNFMGLATGGSFEEANKPENRVESLEGLAKARLDVTR